MLSTIKSTIFGAEVRLVSLASLQALHWNNWKQTIKIKRKGDKKKNRLKVGNQLAIEQLISCLQSQP